MIKIALFSLLITLVLAFDFSNNTFAQTSGNPIIVLNQQPESLGTITIIAPSGNYYLAVPGMSSDTVSIPDTATSITINGQTVSHGTQAILQLVSGKFVVVLWPALNTIAVIDEGVL